MPDLQRRRRHIAGLLLGGVLCGACLNASAAEPARGAAVSEGRHVAMVVCWACHQVADDQEFPPLLKTPAASFAEIANRPGTSAQGLQTFIKTTHWQVGTAARQMPDPMLTHQQTIAVSRYILSLRHP